MKTQQEIELSPLSLKLVYDAFHWRWHSFEGLFVFEKQMLCDVYFIKQV